MDLAILPPSSLHVFPNIDTFLIFEEKSHSRDNKKKCFTLFTPTDSGVFVRLKVFFY